MRDRIAIEFLSRLCMPPVESVRLTDELGCRYLGVCFDAYVANPHGYPAASLRDDPALRRQMIAEMSARNVSVSIGEGFMVAPGKDIADAASDLDLMVELGAPRVNILSLDGDLARSLDQIATFMEMARQRDLEATLEFLPGLAIGDLASALNTLRYVDDPALRLNIDFMHLCRSGGSEHDLAALDPAHVGYAQLCDVPLASQVADYADEACHHRLPPGQGELPIREIIRSLPRDIIIGLEIPMVTAAKQGIGPLERLAPCVSATRALLAEVS